MGNRSPDRLANCDPDVAETLDANRPHTEDMLDIADFTPEQWAWLKDQTRHLEADYVPTRSLFPGI